MNRSSDSIHIWVPGICEGAGGIQAFSRVYVQAVREAYPWADIRVFIKNDALAADDPLNCVSGIKYYSVANYPLVLRTLFLVLFGLVIGLWQRPQCAVTTHLHFLPALRMLHWLRGVKVMSVLHGIEAWNQRSGLRVWAMRAADHLMAVSQFTRQAVIHSYGIDPAKISVVPNTFETERFNIGPKPEYLLKRYGLKSDQLVLLTVSRLALSERYKGHRQVLAALKKIRSVFPQVRYVIVGDGDDLPSLRAAATSRGLNECVIFAGRVAGEELPDHYRLCDAFVMPSSKEGFGIVFLEAMASGKPVVAGKLDGSVDALDKGRLGKLVDPADTKEIADVLCEVLSKQPPEALWQDPAALRAAVVEQFGYTRVSRLMAEDLGQVLDQKATPANTRMRAPNHGLDLAAPRIVVLTQLTSPYQVEFFNALSIDLDGHLEVIYLTHRDRNRQWENSSITHNHLILSETPHMRDDAMEAIRRADLVIFNYYTDWFAQKAIRERARLRKPWVFWGERPGFHQTGILGILSRRLLLLPLHRSSTPIWGVGRFGMEGYQREFGRTRSYQNIPYFSDLKHFQEIERNHAKERVFFYSGSLSHRKGGDLLAKAFVKIARRHPQARLVVLGTGHDTEREMRNLLHHCADRVTWLGFQPWDKLPTYYAMGSIFCFPSRYDGWGLAMVEALASGMPAIGTDRCGAALEFLSDGKAGWMIEAGNEQALEQAMEKAIALPEVDFAVMQVAARAAAVHNDLPEGVHRFKEAIRNVLAHSIARMPGIPDSLTLV